MSILLLLSNEVWNQIISYIPIATIAEIRFLCRSFSTIGLLSKRLNFYGQFSHRICFIDRLYDGFITGYDMFHSRTHYYLNSYTRLYLNYRMQFIKNIFMPVGVLCHMFECPRSEYTINKCFSCSMLHCASQKRFFVSLRNAVGIGSIDSFSDEIENFLRGCSISTFQLKLTYRSDDHYAAVNSSRKRCLKLFCYYSPSGLILMYCKVFLHIVCNFLWRLSKDF